MPALALFLSEPVLASAIAEQFSAPWVATLYASLPEALKAKPDALFTESARLSENADSSLWPSLLFVLAEAGATIPDVEITETFSKPLRLGHVVSRIQLHHSSQAQMNDAEYVLGACHFLPRRRLIVAPDGVTAKLTEKEAAVLTYLLQAMAPVPRDELLAALWGYDGRIDTHTLETHVYRLRALPEMQAVEGWREVILMKQGFYVLNPLWSVKGGS